MKNLETRVNFGRLELILKHPIPPFAIYILNQLDKKLFFWPEMLKENVFHYFINENLGNKQIWTANNAKKKVICLARDVGKALFAVE